MSRQQERIPRGLLRQGDVLLVPVARVASWGERQVEEGSGLVLAEGEATGHAHVVHGRSRLVRTQARWGAEARTFIRIKEPARLVHEEHDPISIEPGAYEVRRQREYSPEPRWQGRSRWVAD